MEEKDLQSSAPASAEDESVRRKPKEIMKSVPPHDEMFYRAFEERYRGSRELIKERLRVYLPFLTHFQEIDEESSAIDLGCGRGEWLELLAENGFDVLGVDLDEGMLAACEERNLPVEKKDALLALQELPDESRAIVSGFHIAEHLPFETLQQLVKEALRVLKPGGLLILETPNPENILVGTSNFYLDPTHQRPLPPQLLSFLPEYYGYARIKVLRLQESAEIRDSQRIFIRDIIDGVSPDYAVVAQKETCPQMMSLFEHEFNKEYGVTLDVLTTRYENSLSRKITEVDEKVLTVGEQIDNELSNRIAETVIKMAPSFSGVLEAKLRKAEKHTAGLLENIRSEVFERIAASEKNIAERFEKALETEKCEVNEHAVALFGDVRSEIFDYIVINEKKIESRFGESLDTKFRELETRTLAMESAFHAIRNSRSWKMTAPYRALGDFIRGTWQGFKNLLKPAVVGAMRFVLARPSLKRAALSILRFFPGLKARLQRLFSFSLSRPSFVATTDGISNSSKTNADESELQTLSPHARRIYNELKAEIERRKREEA